MNLYNSNAYCDRFADDTNDLSNIDAPNDFIPFQLVHPPPHNSLSSHFCLIFMFNILNHPSDPLTMLLPHVSGPVFGFAMLTPHWQMQLLRVPSVELPSGVFGWSLIRLSNVVIFPSTGLTFQTKTATAFPCKVSTPFCQYAEISVDHRWLPNIWCLMLIYVADLGTLM